MRVVKHKIEYVIDCNCRNRIAYVEQEVGNSIRCNYCGMIHNLNGSHDTYILEKVKIQYQTPKDRRIEDKRIGKKK